MMGLLRITVTSVLNAHAHEAGLPGARVAVRARRVGQTRPRRDELPPELGRSGDGPPHTHQSSHRPLPCTGLHHGPVQGPEHLATPLISLAWWFLADIFITRIDIPLMGSLILTGHDREDKT
jgi:hypothetical protein